MKNKQDISETTERLAFEPVLANVPTHFDLRNTKIGMTKYTRAWIDGKRATVPVDIVRTGKLVDGKTIHIHGVIRPTSERIVIYGTGADSRFWGSTYHTKEQADSLGW